MPVRWAILPHLHDPNCNCPTSAHRPLDSHVCFSCHAHQFTDFTSWKSPGHWETSSNDWLASWWKRFSYTNLEVLLFQPISFSHLLTMDNFKELGSILTISSQVLGLMLDLSKGNFSPGWIRLDPLNSPFRATAPAPDYCVCPVLKPLQFTKEFLLPRAKIGLCIIPIMYFDKVIDISLTNPTHPVLLITITNIFNYFFPHMFQRRSQRKHGKLLELGNGPPTKVSENEWI